MKQIIIKTQEELDRITQIEKNEEVIIESELTLSAILKVFGKLRLRAKLNCSWNARYIDAWGNSSVEAWGNSSVEAWENSSVDARENSSVVAWGNSSVRIFSVAVNVILHGFSVCFIKAKLACNLTVKSKYAHIQTYKDLGWFEHNGITEEAKIILCKKVSKDYKTQENTENETLWEIGSTVEHPDYHPENGECGKGKFHACSKPYFCDEFRSQPGDKYIAIEIAKEDLYEWKDNPQYPHKIGFRKAKVLFECDKFGKKIK